MNIKTLTPDVSVMPQVSQSDVAALARRGFRSIIGNRPDGEAPDQPAWDEIAAAALCHGMQARHIPVVASKISDADVAAFAEALRDMPGPIAAYCGSGTRAALLWALANADRHSADELIRIATAQGCDLEPFRPRIEAASPASKVS